MKFKKIFEPDLEEINKKIMEEGDFTLRGATKPRKDYIGFSFTETEEFEFVKNFLCILYNKKNVKNFDGTILFNLIKKIENSDG